MKGQFFEDSHVAGIVVDDDAIPKEGVGLDHLDEVLPVVKKLASPVPFQIGKGSDHQQLGVVDGELNCNLLLSERLRGEIG